MSWSKNPYSRPARFKVGTRHPSYDDEQILREQLAQIAETLSEGGVFLVTGAGVSTDSGIPDYRGPLGLRSTTRPMTYQQFLEDDAARHRYWARSFFGWGFIEASKPNAVHHAVAAWEHSGLLTSVVTQNVDGLHQAAGSADVIDLHGRLNRVRCLVCDARTDRELIQERLAVENSDLLDTTVGDIAPDGDSSIADSVVERFIGPRCEVCGSSKLKPDVVYFGENVPKDRVNAAYAAMNASESVLVLGSSLTVMSGFRFARDAAKRGMPLSIITEGVSRADHLATWRADCRLAPAVYSLSEYVARA